MNTPHTDLRIIKTHNTIANALIELLDEKPFEKIQAQEIIEKALLTVRLFIVIIQAKAIWWAN